MNRATGPQKDLIRGLMRRLELPCDVITGLHQPVFVDAGATPPRFGYLIGQSVDSVLDRLDVSRASALIKALQSRLPEES